MAMNLNNSNDKWKKGIMALCIVLALSACDKKKEKPASSSLTETSQHSSATEHVEHQTKEDRNKPVQNLEQVISEKMNVYIKCYNSLDKSIHSSIVRYTSWVNDLGKGPTGNERIVYGIYPVTQERVTNCLSEIKKVAEMKPELKAIDSIAVNYIESSAKLVPEINLLADYYDQEDYKDDNFSKGKENHHHLMAGYQKFESVSAEFSQSIEKISDERQITFLQHIEKENGLTLDYYSLAILIDAKQINRMIEGDTFDTTQALAMVAELQNKVKSALPLVTKLKNEGGTSYMGYDALFREIDSYVKAAKERIRRVRDNVSYTDFEKRQLGTNSEWMVEGSVGKLIDKYNRFIDQFNRL
ncbi:hypothetical protein Xmau_00498 [Xenorhabdus mauleonii]|uniref:DUF3829 domain-containing protein n=1 Tax=Xenorhabdus mauleonii TaxID=351675 RepID=A0A1I3J5V1_9GAMM|nr:YiiG family protein [Xenorhabdus mauleonii]PHM46102.1 hypothetical protein Xmau_00498 [Xenorhabdus mauleonii]SFI55486.1 Protein of unknown function [Xenorhabdus mauleonii]